MSNLHDCPFDLDEATFDEQAGTWTGKFFRPVWEDSAAIEHTRSKLVFSRCRLPVVLASVCVSGVQDVRVIHDQGIGWYTLNKIKRISAGVRIEFCEALDIDLRLISGIDVSYDEDPLPGMRAVYRYFLSIESGPEIVKVANE